MKQIFTLGLLLCCFLFANATPENIVPNIHVDQFGYLPSSKKIAVIGDPLYGYNAGNVFNCTANDVYELRDWFTDEVIFSATLLAWNSGNFHDQSGDFVWWFDFSSVTSEGSYYVHALAANASSGRFEISACVYSNAMRSAVRALYYQRCGTEKNAAHATAAWADDACHIGTNQDTQCSLVGSNGTGIKNLSGGWHDAGDYNKYVNFAYEAVLDLCDAAGMNSEIWTDDFNIPESGNGVPDILDEIKYELDWLLKMQNTDGSVLCMVGAESYNSASPPSNDVVQRVYGPATTAASISAAAMFAKAASLYTGSYHDQLVLAATNAWNWADANPDQVFYNSGVIVSGEQQTDEYETAMRKMVAAVYLYEATNDPIYQTYVDANYTEAHMMQWEYVYPFETAIQNALVHYSTIVGINAIISDAIQNVYTSSVEENNPDNLLAYINATDAYLAYLADQNYTWGSNTFKARQAMILKNMLQYNLSTNVQYDEATEGYLHYFHGVNPNGICFLTNMNSFGAEKSANSIYHGWFHNGSSLWDEVGTSVYGPAPGFIPGGVNPTYNLDACCSTDCGSTEANAMCDLAAVTPPLGQPIQKAWRDWNADWPQNSWTVTEIGIYTQASYIKMLSHYVGQNCLNENSIQSIQPQKLSLKLFPNPCNDELIVNTELLHAGISTIEICDNTGRLISSFTASTRSGKSAQVIDTSALHAGIYFLQVKNGEAVRTEKFIVVE
jgi:endoglucanase